MENRDVGYKCQDTGGDFVAEIVMHVISLCLDILNLYELSAKLITVRGKAQCFHSPL